MVPRRSFAIFRAMSCSSTSRFEGAERGESMTAFVSGTGRSMTVCAERWAACSSRQEEGQAPKLRGCWEQQPEAAKMPRLTPERTPNLGEPVPDCREKPFSGNAQSATSQDELRHQAPDK